MTEPPETQPQDPTPGQRKRADELVRLAKVEFGMLRVGEEKMLHAVAFGRACDLADQPIDSLQILWWSHRVILGSVTDSHGSEWGCWERWGEHRIIRETVLRWLCVREEAQELVDPNGIHIHNAKVNGQLELDGARIPFKLVLKQCALPDGIAMIGTHATTVALPGSCTGPVVADRLVTSGGVFFRNGFRSRGAVRLHGALIGGNLSCVGCLFDCVRDDEGKPVGDLYTLKADGARVTGNVILGKGFQAKGPVHLLNASIGGNFDCVDGSFDCARNHEGNPVPVRENYAINADGLTVNGSTQFRGAIFSAIVSLAGSHLAYLNDEAETWPKQLILGGCRYDAIHAQSPTDATSRLVWLGRHDSTVEELKLLPEHFFNPQPYIQLASVLRKQGHIRDANTIMIAAMRKQRLSNFHERVKHQGANPVRNKIWAWWARMWSKAFDLVSGFGYRRWRPLWFMLAFIIVGGLVFGGLLSGHPDAWMAPSQGLAARDFHAWLHSTGDASSKPGWLGEYPHFKAWVYSADTFLPLVNLHQENFWVPRTWWVRTIYLPLHIFMGWVITTLFAVSFSGLIRRNESQGG